VKERENDLEWVRGFGLVMNALDNMGELSFLSRGAVGGIGGLKVQMQEGMSTGCVRLQAFL
jgi:hypothetical protein